MHTQQTQPASEKRPTALTKSTSQTMRPSPDFGAYKRPVRVWFSSRVGFPKYHVDPNCSGLEHVGDEWRASKRFTSKLALMRSENGRPCRRCALETLLVDVAGAPSIARSRPVLAEFSGQPNPKEGNPFRFDYRVVTDSGAERLVRLAAALGLCVSESVAGPVAYGFVPSALACILARNLRTIVNPSAVEMPSRMEVEVLWALMTDDPPECGVESQLDLWTVAQAVVMAPARHAVHPD